MTVLAVTADLHIDAYGQRVNPETGLNARLVDYLRTTTTVALETRRAGADVLVVAGDFTERRHPAPWLVARIREALGHGPSRQVYVRGNHDGEVAGRSIVDVLDEGQRTGVSRPQVVRVNDVAIAAIPHLDRRWLRAQEGFAGTPDAEVFRVLAEQYLGIARGLYAEAKAGGATHAMLVGHQVLAGGAMSESQRAFLGDLDLVVDARAIAAIGFDLAVFGHLHRHQIVVDEPHPVVYAGSLERVDFGEEGEEKGWILVDVSPAGVEWSFQRVEARRFVTLTGEQIAAIADRRADADLVGAVVRVVDLDPGDSADATRLYLESLGVFEVTEIRVRPLEATAVAGGLSESLSAEEALEAWFADDPERDALVALGRELLAGVA